MTEDEKRKLKTECLHYAIMAKDGPIVETAQRFYDFIAGENTADVIAAAEYLAEAVLRSKE